MRRFRADQRLGSTWRYWRMPWHRLVTLLLAVGCIGNVLCSRVLPAQEVPAAKAANADGVLTGESIQQLWRVGVTLKGGAEPSRNILVTIPLPGDWPEQKVRVQGKEAPPEITKLTVRDTLPELQQVVAVIPTLRPQQELTLTYDLAVTLYKIAAPDNPDSWVIPKSVPRELREYLEISPGISYRDSKLRNQVRELTKDKESDWAEIKSLYEWVQAEMQPKGGEPTDALDCFRERSGHPEDICGLFVAMCRAHKVPARMVWVIESQHAEFYLVNDQGVGRWFPVVFGGFTEFGSLSSPKLIEMKGDSFEVPEKKERQKYVFEHVVGEAASRPKVRFIRELLPAGGKEEPR
jgi:transglutaminase-like putative cysteine protease